MWYGYGGIALFMVPMWLLSLQGESNSRMYDVVGVLARPVLWLVFVLVLIGMVAAYYRNSHRKIVIDVTRDGLTVKGRPGESFSFGDAQLGPWAFWQSMGSALHLRCGAGSFVLGGRDHRLASDTHADAPATRDVDEWLWAAEFDELLALAGRRGRSDGVAPQSAEPHAAVSGHLTRCALFPNPEAISVQPLWAPWRTTRMANSFLVPRQPILAIDVGADTVSVVDPNTNMVRASAQLAQVTAAPEVYVLLRPYVFMWPLRFFLWGYLKTFQWTTPVLVVRIPGIEPLSISCRDEPGNDYLFALTRTLANRFSWHFKPPMRINRLFNFKRAVVISLS